MPFSTFDGLPTAPGHLQVSGPNPTLRFAGAANAPLPNVLAGALIGRVGSNGPVFAIGSGVTIKMPADGLLFLGVNDDGFADNRGEFRVYIGRTNTRR